MKNLFILLLILSLSALSFAQEEESWHCATDEIYNDLISKNPDILRQKHELDAYLKEFIRNNQKTGDVYVIPVVFHIVHNYGAENISYSQIEESIAFMNRDFRLQRSDTAQIVDAFKPIAADTKIEFRLAKIDPWGDCTIGVTRTVSETTYGGGEDAKYAAPSWPSDKYLNVWTVHSLGHGAAGWSYYPGTAPHGSDGIILLHDYVGSTGTSSPNRGSVLTHEAGHYLNLGHPWGHTNEPEVPSNCEIDDDIDDTPNTIGHKSCNVNAITCGSLDNVQNFMEYSYCYKMFTRGQADMMRAVLNNSVAGRNNLVSISNRNATGTTDGYVAQVCAPISDFAANKKMGCAGVTVQYNDYSHNTDFIGHYQWSFDGGIPESSNEAYPAVQYNNKGSFSTQLYVENETDSDLKVVNDYIKVYDVNDGFSLPYTESFESTIFPRIDDNDYNDMIIDAKGEKNWEQSGYGFSGKSIRIVNKNNPNGTNNRIYLPNIYVDEPESPITVSFKAAYGRAGADATDRLKFFVSNSCGDSLKIVSVFSANILSSGVVSSWANYIPTASHWKTHSFTISANSLKTNNLRLVIEAEAGGGNTIYIDDVKFEYAASNIEVAKTQNIAVYPNPFDSELFIENSDFNKEYSIYFYDFTGKLIASEVSHNSVFDASSIFQSVVSGLYLIKVQSGDSIKTFKIVKD